MNLTEETLTLVAGPEFSKRLLSLIFGLMSQILTSHISQIGGLSQNLDLLVFSRTPALQHIQQVLQFMLKSVFFSNVYANWTVFYVSSS